MRPHSLVVRPPRAKTFSADAGLEPVPRPVELRSYQDVCCPYTTTASLLRRADGSCIRISIAKISVTRWALRQSRFPHAWWYGFPVSSVRFLSCRRATPATLSGFEPDTLPSVVHQKSRKRRAVTNGDKLTSRMVCEHR